MWEGCCWQDFFCLHEIMHVTCIVSFQSLLRFTNYQLVIIYIVVDGGGGEAVSRIQYVYIYIFF